MQHNVIIKSFDDYKTQFGNKFFQGKEIKPEFKGHDFIFSFDNCFYQKNIYTGFTQIRNKYKKLINIYPISITKIECAQDYTNFYKTFVNITANKCTIKNEFNDFMFKFQISFYEDNKINEFLIHNYLLLRYKLLDCYNKFELQITGNENQKNSNIARITTYVANCEQEIKESIFFNGTNLFRKEMKVGKLFPAMFITKETLRFLREPITPNVWDIIINPEKIGPESFKKITKSEIINKHWFLFQVCQKYLFEEFLGNISITYTEIRSAVFRSANFRNHILKMPLFAVILFAQYDYFYRNSMLKDYKSAIGKNQLNSADILLNLQQQQSYTFYRKYLQMYQRGDDIKSLVKLEKNNIKSFSISETDNIIVHENIISELFESTTIAEGLLQLMENAVEHANGGLLSVRIREYNDQDKKYLNEEYKQYFEGLCESKISKFYLEVKLSDISNVNFKETFFTNIKERFSEDNRLKEWFNTYGNEICSSNKIFSPFFAPQDNIKTAWEEYYEISHNQIHHFGLQIFDSIITTKNGLLHISGHNDEYSKTECQLDSDKSLPGTSYRIVLPINHSHKENTNIIVDTSYEHLIGFDEINKFKNSSSEIRISEPNWEGIKNFIIEYKNNIKDKELVISEICNCINEFNNYDKCLLLVNYEHLNNSANYAIELLLKGLFLSLLQHPNITPPVAIINLPSHSLLEASRIIALFYGKNGKAAQNMENIQIYLKGKEVGEEILFVGSNLNKNADRLRRIAMARGVMFEYWQIAQIFMQRLENEETR